MPTIESVNYKNINLNLQDLFSCYKVDWPKECKTEVRDGNLETIWLKIAERSLSPPS